MSSKKFIDESNLFDDDFFDDEPELQKEVVKETKKEEVKPTTSIKSNQSFKKQKVQNKPQQIHVKPTIEVEKEKDTNPYKDEYKRKKPVNKKPKKRERVAVKKLISISQKNLQVVDILKEIKKDYPSESEFICQAIKEKYERDKRDSGKDLKDLVKESLEELVGEKYIILKGSSDIAISNSPPTPSVPQSEINNSIKEKEDEENKELLKGIISSWDIG